MGGLPLRVGFRGIGRISFYSCWLTLILFWPRCCPQDCDGNGVSDPVQIAASPELGCNANGILDLCEMGGYISPPVEQDVCELAQWICPSETYTGSTIGCTNPGYTSGSCSEHFDEPDVWYVYMPKSDGFAYVVLEVLSPGPCIICICVYDACPNDGGSCLSCGCALADPDGPYEFRRLNVSRDNKYYIQVSSPPAYRGNFNIELVGPNCMTSPDCDGNAVLDECEAPPTCGAGVLCYDDGDGTADIIIDEPNPASFLVKFSVPDTFAGPRKVSRVTWYAGSGTIESPKVVVRGDLAGGFGTSQACIIEDATAVVPNAFNQVDVSQNPNQFVVHGGDVFYAGVYGGKISIGADSSVTTRAVGADSFTFTWDTCNCGQVPVPTPVEDAGSRIGCWNARNYRLDAGGIQSPGEMISVASAGSPSCRHNHTWWWTTTYVHTDYSSWRLDQRWACECHTFCKQSFHVQGRDWLIRVALSGMCSPELISGCTENGLLIYEPFETFTPTGTFTITPTPTVTPTATVTLTSTPTSTGIPAYHQPSPVAELNSDGSDFRPYLTQDLLEVFFVTDRTGDRDIWSATRESVDAPWNSPFPVTELNSDDQDSSPVLSADGLEVFFSSHRDLQPTSNWNQVFRSTRPNRHSPWSDPLMVVELNPPPNQDYFSVPSHLSADGLRIYTYRRFGADHDIYVSSRASVGAPFSGPTPIPGDVNSTSSEAGGVLSGDEMTMIFGRVTDRWNLFIARRPVSGGPFEVLRELTELNDPVCGTQTGFISSDLGWIWFSSDRPGCPQPHDIFMARMVVETPTPTQTLSTGVKGVLWMFR